MASKIGNLTVQFVATTALMAFMLSPAYSANSTAECEEDEECVVVVAPKKNKDDRRELEWYIPTKGAAYTDEINFNEKKFVATGGNLSQARDCRQAMEDFQTYNGQMVNAQIKLADGSLSCQTKCMKKQPDRDSSQERMLEACKDLLPDAAEISAMLSNNINPPPGH